MWKTTLALVAALVLTTTGMTSQAGATLPVPKNLKPMTNGPILKNAPVVNPAQLVSTAQSIVIKGAKPDGCCAGMVIVKLNIAAPEVWKLNPRTGGKLRLSDADAAAETSGTEPSATGVSVSYKPPTGATQNLSFNNGVANLPATGADGHYDIMIRMASPTAAVPVGGSAPGVTVRFLLTKTGGSFTDAG